MQIMHVILDKILKLSTYYTPLSLVVAKLCDLKNSPVFLAHPVYAVIRVLYLIAVCNLSVFSFGRLFICLLQKL